MSKMYYILVKDKDGIDDLYLKTDDWRLVTHIANNNNYGFTISTEPMNIDKDDYEVFKWHTMDRLQ